jgi:predicted PurR-regulated permease PerM
MFKTWRNPDEVAALMSGAAAAVLVAIIVGMLYFGREVFVPIALAILLSFVLAPAVRLLQQWHIPRVLSVAGVVLLAFLLISTIGGVIAPQINQLAGDLPRYQSTMREKIQSLRGKTATSSTLERAADVLQDLGKELDKPRDPRPATPPAQPPAPGQEARPIPVEVRQPPPSALQNLAALISPLLRPLTTTGITIIFVVFILLQREDLRNRLIKLAGSHDLQKTTAALDDAARRLSRLFLTQLALNSAFGIVIGAGLWLIGVPSPVLWGILAGILRFVPYIGAFIAALFPLALAAAVDPGWSMLVWTAALFLAVEPIVGHVIEPLVYGHSAGLSPVAVVVSATFWTALWGPLGLVLATPLTICLVVLGRHVERLKFLDVMFGDRPALSPPEIFYQRMLAADPAEAVDHAEEFLKEKPLSVYYDEVALKGLKLGQIDIARGSLDPSRIEKIKAAVSELLDDLAEQEDRKRARGATQDAEAAAAVETVEDAISGDLPFLNKEELAPAWQAETPLLCAAARSPLDECAARMLAQLLGKHGLGARVEGADALSASNIFGLETAGIAMVCLSYLDSSSAAHMRYTIRRVRRRFPEAKILLGCWLGDADTAPAADALKADGIATTLRDALRLCLDAASARGQATPIEFREPAVLRDDAA